MPKELDDAEFIHSVDFLCAAPVLRGFVWNKAIFRLADACYDKVANGKFFFLTFRNQVLRHPALVKLLSLDSVRHAFVKLRTEAGFSQGCIISNLKSFDPRLFRPGDGMSWDVWPFVLVSGVVAAFANEALDLFSKSLPSGEERQKLWIRRALLSSAKGLARPGLAAAAAVSVFNIIETARDRSVSEHLRDLYQLVDHRGSDVRLDSGDILESAAQAVPYPAPIWDWRTVAGVCGAWLCVCVGVIGRSGRSVGLRFSFVFSWFLP